MSWMKFFKAVEKAVVAANKASKARQAEKVKRPRSFPVMTIDMIDSNGQPITKAQAIKLYKQYMLAVGYLDKDEVNEHAGYFSDEIDQELGFLQEAAAGDLQNLKDELSMLRAQRREAADQKTKEDLDDEIFSVKGDLEHEKSTVAVAKARLADFKNDKRQFLIDYVNREVQGTP